MPRILVVDDDEVDRELVRRCLASVEDLEIVEARNGQEALKSLSRTPPDLILTDLRMPKMDGLELVRQVGREDGTPPVVLMTSRGSEKIAVQALQAGAASYVPKRAMKTELAPVLQKVLEIRDARRARRQAVSFMESREARFSLTNDVSLISPLSAWFQDGLEHLGFATASVRAQIGIALMEAVSNAMIHGNLEIDSGLRRSDREAFDALVARRRGEPPWADRKVHCLARESIREVEYTIRDEGKGFDVKDLPDPSSPESILDVAGRGIYLIRTFMDSVDFNEAGNEITMKKTRDDQEERSGPETQAPSNAAAKAMAPKATR